VVVPLRLALIAVALAEGGFMLADGLRNLLTGTYFGGTLGPWSLLVAGAGLDPHHFGAVFVALGLLWLGAQAALLARTPWSPWAGLAAGVLTLWYVPVGTFLALVWLVLLWLSTRARAGSAAG
jgi:hypothetical protein